MTRRAPGPVDAVVDEIAGEQSGLERPPLEYAVVLVDGRDQVEFDVGPVVAQPPQHRGVDRHPGAFHPGHCGHVPATEQRLPQPVGAGPGSRQHPLQEGAEAGRRSVCSSPSTCARSAPSHGPPRITKARSSVFWSAVIAGMSWWGQGAQQAPPAGQRDPVGGVPVLGEQVQGFASGPASRARGSIPPQPTRSRPRTTCRQRSGNGGPAPSSSCHSRISLLEPSSRATRQTGTGRDPDSETNSKSRTQTDRKGSPSIRCRHRLAALMGTGRTPPVIVAGKASVPIRDVYGRRNARAGWEWGRRTPRQSPRTRRTAGG